MSTTPSNIGRTGHLTRELVESTVQEFILTQFPAARSRGIGHDDSLLKNGIVDSLGILEVVSFLESEFRLTVTDDEMLSDHFETISRITNLVMQKGS